jgi:hypothetical protein
VVRRVVVLREQPVELVLVVLLAVHFLYLVAPEAEPTSRLAGLEEIVLLVAVENRYHLLLMELPELDMAVVVLGVIQAVRHLGVLALLA